MKKLILFSTFLVLVFSAYAQKQAQILDVRTGKFGVQTQTLHTASMEVDISNGGSLITAMRIPNVATGGMTSILDGLSLWMGSLDFGGNLQLSIQRDSANDFVAGFRNLPNFDRVWKVTQDEIRLHRLDFADNGVIDNPIPAIFEWPGTKNPHLFPASFDNFITTAGYMDFNNDGTYNPRDGDYPNFYFKKDYAPTELVYVPMFTKWNGQGILPVLMDFGLQFYTYNCPYGEAVDHTVFGEAKVFIPSETDSLIIGYFMDGNIGNPNDDFIGSWPEINAMYFFNGDSIDEGGFEDVPPALVFWQRHGMGDALGDRAPIKGVISPNLTSGGEPAMDMPDLPIEWYNYLNNRWKNGQEMFASENGFSDKTAEITSSIFHGDPIEMGAWTERNMGQIPQNRIALANSRPTAMVIGSGNSFEFSLSYLPDGKEENIRPVFMDYLSNFPIPSNLDPIEPQPTFSEYCLGISPTMELNVDNTVFSIFPNPAQNQIELSNFNENDVDFIQIFNNKGQMVLRKKRNLEKLISISHLPQGNYVVQAILSSGTTFSRVFVKI